ncbi:AAA family ATPase [Devosia albogilva]|uniref:AAA family ATPase n=1 Tax=Devosia albogilva TaxID=429726 RepID=A0ABW5QKK7_9HYPH
MKLAELSDLRRRLAKRNIAAAPSIQRISISGLTGFRDLDIAPQTGFLALCGGTGVGKTAFLESLYYALSSSEAEQPRGLKRLSGARVRVEVALPTGTYTFDGTVGRRAPDEDWEGLGTGVQFVGLENRTTDIQAALRDQDIDVLKEGVGRGSLDGETVSALSLICRRVYSSVGFYEIEVGESIVPLFEVTVGELTYDSTTMATGELSTFYLAWALQRAESYGVLILEEPEAFLPPVSHRAIFGLIAKAALQKHLGIVLSTHAATVASELESTNLIAIRKHENLARISGNDETKAKVLSYLGLTPSRTIVALVEDEVGQEIFLHLFRQAELPGLVNLEVVVEPDGAGAIGKRLDFVPAIKSALFLGVLDGDMKQEASSWETPHEIVFLPFSRPIETELLETMRRNVPEIAARVGVSEDSLSNGLSDTEGGNYHDAFKQVAGAIGVDRKILTHATYEIWAQQESNAGAVQEFLAKLSMIAQARS